MKPIPSLTEPRLYENDWIVYRDKVWQVTHLETYVDCSNEFFCYGYTLISQDGGKWIMHDRNLDYVKLSVKDYVKLCLK